MVLGLDKGFCWEMGGLIWNLSGDGQEASVSLVLSKLHRGKVEFEAEVACGEIRKERQLNTRAYLVLKQDILPNDWVNSSAVGYHMQRSVDRFVRLYETSFVCI